MLEPEVLVVALRSWLSNMRYDSLTLITLTPWRFPHEIVTPTLGDGMGNRHRFELMRTMYRDLPYDSSPRHMDLHVIQDSLGRTWQCEPLHKRKWVLEFRPLLRD